ncbi:30S ribosomal protein S4 [Candidatus Pacearchaeota archaeon]|nr:30S ribosomal protein S4 [Candidatus Pacearchaeota archaeon]
MIRRRKKYSRPKKPFDKQRIEAENELIEKYGLKSKREIWKADSSIAKIRNLAKELITKTDEEKNAFIERLQKKGYNVQILQDALALDKEDLLKRRLQTIVFLKGFVRTPKQARQLIVHRHVSLGENIINIPSYNVDLNEESDVRLNIVLKVPESKKSKIEQIKEDVLNEENNIEGGLIE